MTATGNPLVAQYTFTPKGAGTATVEFGLGTNYGFETSPQAIPAGVDQVNILVAGMKANTTYHMRAVVTYAGGTIAFDNDHTFTTGSIPQGLRPQVKVTLPSGGRPMRGVELLSLNPGGGSQLPVAALDPQGNLIWYYSFDFSLGIAQPIKLLPNGHFLLVIYGNSGGGLVREIDLAGNTVNQFALSDLNQWLAAAGFNLTLYGIHHDFLLLPNGHLILLVNSYQTFADLAGYPGQTNVLGDSIVDLDPTYKPVWVWSAFDHLDVNRHPMNFPDWTHANDLVYSPDDGNLLLSLRHQHWIVKIDYQDGRGSGNILWRLGYQGDFTLASGAPANWFYAQHDANLASPNSTGDFLLALFDNGDNRVLDSSGTTCGSTGAAPCYSRPALVDVNEATMTANLEWSYPTVYSFWGGVTMLLPNGDVFANLASPADDSFGARVLELTQDPNPQVVLQVEVANQNSYRTIHLPSLYPNVQW